MKLTNMARTPETAKAETMPSPVGYDKYPYGIRLHIDNESLKKLGLKELPAVGAKLKLEAIVEVCEVCSNESLQGGEHKSMSVQITEMGLKEEKSATKTIYGED